MPQFDKENQVHRYRRPVMTFLEWGEKKQERIEEGKPEILTLEGTVVSSKEYYKRTPATYDGERKGFAVPFGTLHYVKVEGFPTLTFVMDGDRPTVGDEVRAYIDEETVVRYGFDTDDKSGQIKACPIQDLAIEAVKIEKLMQGTVAQTYQCNKPALETVLSR